MDTRQEILNSIDDLFEEIANRPLKEDRLRELRRAKQRSRTAMYEAAENLQRTGRPVRAVVSEINAKGTRSGLPKSNFFGG